MHLFNNKLKANIIIKNIEKSTIIMFEEYGDMLTVDEVAEILGIGKTHFMKISVAVRCIASC